MQYFSFQLCFFFPPRMIPVWGRRVCQYTLKFSLNLCVIRSTSVLRGGGRRLTSQRFSEPLHSRTMSWRGGKTPPSYSWAFLVSGAYIMCVEVWCQGIGYIMEMRQRDQQTTHQTQDALFCALLSRCCILHCAGTGLCIWCYQTCLHSWLWIW